MSLNFGSSTWLIAPVVLVLLRLLSIEATAAYAQKAGGVLVYRTGSALRILIGGGIVFFAYQVIDSLGSEKGWVIGMLSGILIFLSFAWPSVLTISPTSISQRRWWRRSVTIPWSEVTAIEKNSVGDLQVFGRMGEYVVFTRYHVDPAGFETEVRQRAKLDQTLDASRRPSLHL